MSPKVGVISAVVVVSLLVCGTGTVVAGRYLDFISASRELPDAVTKAKAVGIPWTAKDLQPNPPVADADNAAPLLTKMGDAFRTNKAINAALEALKKDDYAEASKQLASCSVGLRLATEAAAKPGVDFKRDWDLGPQLLFPEFAGIKQGVKAVGVRALVRANSGDTTGTLADLKSMGSLARHAGSEPILIGMLVGIACNAIRDKDIERIAALWKDSPQGLKALEATTTADRYKPNIGNAMRGEAWFGVSTTRNFSLLGGMKALSPSSDDTPTPKLDPTKIKRDGLPDGVKDRAFMARHLQAWTKAWPTITNPNLDAVEATKPLEEMSQSVEKEPGLSYLLLKIMFPVFSQAGAAAVRAEAMDNATVALIRVLEYKHQHGAFPRHLAEAKADLMDPFTKKTLRYKRSREGVRIYSLGFDKVDDGGLSRSELAKISGDSTNAKGDDVVAYPPLVSRD